MAFLAGVQGDILCTSPPSVALTNDTLTNPSSDGMTWVEGTAAHRYWDPTVALVAQVQCDEIQTVSITGSPTGGTFTLTFSGDTTAGIAYNASAAAVQTALDALADLGANAVTCTGGPLPATPVVVEWTGGSFKDTNQATLTANSGGLTGGSSPTVNIAVTQNGQAWNPPPMSFTTQYVGGIIILSSALLGSNVGVRAHSGNYYPYASIGNTTDWQWAGTKTMQDATTHKGVGGSMWADYLPVLTTGKITLKKWWVDQTFINHLVNGDVLIVSCVTPSGNRYEGFCNVSDSNLLTAVKSLTENDITFQMSGQQFPV